MRRFFLGFLMYFEWFLGALIIPKWLMLTSRRIAILFGSFLELPKMWQNMDPRAPYLLQKYFKRIRKHMDIFYKHHLFVNMHIEKLEKFGKSVYRFFELLNIWNFGVAKHLRFWIFKNLELLRFKNKILKVLRF